ncbi:hypothetical protein BDV97DRAFT_289886 [Delphinella strobiligena]|nr:hypothetical protein BDV97DRAFT_289886 [Delphinella strobiligena]
MPKAAFRPIIQEASAKRKAIDVDFDPKRHIQFKPPPEIMMMKDLGYADDTGVSPVAVSQPFQLFSTEAIHQMRTEVMNSKVMEECKYQSNIAACQIRGYAPKYAPFTHDAWNNPETLSIISNIAGVDLIPSMNFEVGHVNFSVKSEKETQEELAAINREKEGFASDEGIAGCPWEDDSPVVGWHTDSYPFVCVLMMSDCTNMVGGETALRTPSGDVLKVRGPQMGCAVILQGRYITHQALRALGAQERITSVTSFRPRSPYLKDDTVLTTVRPISDLPELYYQFGEYRLSILEERLRTQLKVMREHHAAGKKVNTKLFKKFLEEQQRFLERTNEEVVEEDQVKVGHIDEMQIPNASKSAEEAMRAAKRARMN